VWLKSRRRAPQTVFILDHFGQAGRGAGKKTEPWKCDLKKLSLRTERLLQIFRLTDEG